jgi:hypothetical protein
MLQIVLLYERWPADTVRDVIQRDVLNIISGKRSIGESGTLAIEQLVRESVENADSLRGLANDLLIAKAFRPSFESVPEE